MKPDLERLIIVGFGRDRVRNILLVSGSHKDKLFDEFFCSISFKFGREMVLCMLNVSSSRKLKFKRLDAS